VVINNSDSGLLQTMAWCRKHRAANSRPLELRKPVGTPIPAHVKIYPCSIKGCPNVCEVERTAKMIDNVPTPGWLVRPYCRPHRNPANRPVGWLPPPADRWAQWRWRFMQFLGITRWSERGHYDGRAYRLKVGHLLYIVPTPAIRELQAILETPWEDRETLGFFAARYNLAIAAVVGATYAVQEAGDHGKT
jgi:hypothetical protein